MLDPGKSQYFFLRHAILSTAILIFLATKGNTKKKKNGIKIYRYSRYDCLPDVRC